MARPEKADQRQSVHGLDEHPYLHVLERDGFTCQLCGSRRNLEVHHIRPRSRGGDDAEANLVTLCQGCHKDTHAGKAPLLQ